MHRADFVTIVFFAAEPLSLSKKDIVDCTWSICSSRSMIFFLQKVGHITRKDLLTSLSADHFHVKKWVKCLKLEYNKLTSTFLWIIANRYALRYS